jgi:cis-3-alkyl-4-acyloxetan-2-one decarboxylase
MKIMGFENSAAVDSNWIAAYSAAFPTKDDCVGAIEFPLDAVLGRIAPYIKEGFPLLDNLKSKPAMLTVGMKDRTIAPDRQLADFRAVWPAVRSSNCRTQGTLAKKTSPIRLSP